MSPELEREIPWVTTRQIGHWTAQGWIKPQDMGRGPGGGYYFDRTERRVLITMARLVKAGVKPPEAAGYARKAVDASIAKGKSQITMRLGEGVVIQLDV